MYDAQIATFQAVFKKVFVFEGQRSGSCIIGLIGEGLRAGGASETGGEMGGKIGRIDLIAESGKCRVSDPQE